MFRGIRVNRATQQLENGGALARAPLLAEPAKVQGTLVERIMKYTEELLRSKNRHNIEALFKEPVYKEFKRELLELSGSERAALKADLHVHAFKIFAHMAFRVMELQPNVEIIVEEEKFDILSKIGKLGKENLEETADIVQDAAERISAIVRFVVIITPEGNKRKSLHDAFGMLKVINRIGSKISEARD